MDMNVNIKVFYIYFFLRDFWDYLEMREYRDYLDFLVLKV